MTTTLDGHSTPSGLPPREPSAVDTIATDYVHALLELVPELGTSLGIPGYDHRLSDYSPAGHDAVEELRATTLARLDEVKPRDETDRITLHAMRHSLGLERRLHAADEHLRELNVLASPIQSIRSIFDMMPTQTTEHWQNIAERLAAVPTAMEQYALSLQAGLERGLHPAKLQVRECITQCLDIGAPEDSFFFTFVCAARPEGSAPSDELADDLAAGAGAAAQAYRRLSEFLTEHVLPTALDQDGVGRERYELFSATFLGATVDLDETYQWGLAQLSAIDAEQKAVIRELFGEDLPLAEAFARLDNDQERQLHGRDALVEWMTGVSQEAIERLDGTMMEIPQILRRLECKIAPTSFGSIYYTAPSLDFSRPGRMWWAVPEGVDTFSSWQERTTVYHEGVPGHHLQIGMATLLNDQLNLWRSTMSWTSGHGEGWALYSERLMNDLGFLSDPGDRMGMLDAQRLRAARVVLDIGMHLGLPFPQEWRPSTPEEDAEPVDYTRWNYRSGWAFLRQNVAMEEAALRFEYHRYLGWPGQAPSYKVGQRLWEQIRDDYLAAHLPPGASPEQRAAALRSFHSEALALGGMGLDTLAEAMSRV